MLIEKVSMLTNKVHIREIDVTREQVENWQGGMLIQEAMPNLSIDDREFIQTGTTADEWDALEKVDKPSAYDPFAVIDALKGAKRTVLRFRLEDEDD